MGLERLSRDLLAAPSDARDLPALLRKHVPGMFPSHRVMVWLSPETYLLQFPDGKDNLTPAIWEWLLKQTEPKGYLENTILPWETKSKKHFTLLATPILDPGSGETIGGLYIELLPLTRSWNKKTIREHYPALQNLAAQVATSIQNVRAFEQSRSQADLETLTSAIGQKIQRTTSVEDALQTAIREIGLALGASRVSANISAAGQNGKDSLPLEQAQPGISSREN
jgi:hypothetical protein